MSDRDKDYIKKYLTEDKWEEALLLLDKGVSPQYIVGNVNFYGYTINVDSRVLIPRFETELLVEKTILFLKNNFKRQIKILDVGTGSGCIAIVLKKETNCFVDASDVSSDVLDLARENAKKNNVEIKFILSDVFSNIKEKYDVIISNPPYISYDEEIEDIVKNNEPHIALYAENNGLHFYEEILKNCKLRLNNKFLIAFEIGCKQANDITNMAYKYLGDKIKVSVEKDYNNRDRFVFIYNV